MPLGILDVKGRQVLGKLLVPIGSLFKANRMANTLGTVDIFENERADDQPPTYHSHLKYDRSGSVPILLVPQPSDDPNDPLVCPELSKTTSQILLIEMP
jgi:hypothetical protein